MNRGSNMNGVMGHRRIMNEGAGGSQNRGATMQDSGISLDNSASRDKSGVSISESMVS